MGNHERQPLPGEQPEMEILDSRHFYAAYVFDEADKREKDIQEIIQQASELGYPVRYWWLSDAMELGGFPNRMIICVHHPSASEDAGMDLYEALKEKGVAWDELDAAVVDEYRYLGKPAKELGDLRSPYGNWLFPHAVTDGERRTHSTDALFTITRQDVREELRERLGRGVTDEELSDVLIYFRKALDYLDWTFYLDEALSMSVEARQRRWDERSRGDLQEDNPPTSQQSEAHTPTDI